jgi:hypothetical protein
MKIQFFLEKNCYRKSVGLKLYVKKKSTSSEIDSASNKINYFV